MVLLLTQYAFPFNEGEKLNGLLFNSLFISTMGWSWVSSIRMVEFCEMYRRMGTHQGRRCRQVKILDEQAIGGATQKVVAEKANESQPRKRSRINVKKDGDKVYTATKDKAQKLEANTPQPAAAAAETVKETHWKKCPRRRASLCEAA